uniref:Uncharacterized protein n=1 Tax=Arundo donax TaxID=35708 RepID=A0A0A9FLY3_ARUDO
MLYCPLVQVEYRGSVAWWSLLLEEN